ncbi:hypothetical protein GGI11_007624, partial [Coemansia sp. RSA 2049]
MSGAAVPRRPFVELEAWAAAGVPTELEERARPLDAPAPARRPEDDDEAAVALRWYGAWRVEADAAAPEAAAAGWRDLAGSVEEAASSESAAGESGALRRNRGTGGLSSITAPALPLPSSC